MGILTGAHGPNFGLASACSTGAAAIDEAFEIIRRVAAAVMIACGTEAAITSTKSVTGHLLGAAGAVQATWSIMVLRDGIIPPTISFATPDPQGVLGYVPNVARRASARVVLSNSFGFGGHNSILAFRAVR